MPKRSAKNALAKEPLVEDVPKESQRARKGDARVKARVQNETQPPARTTGKASKVATRAPASGKKRKRLPPRQTFLVAATVPEGAEAGQSALRVYAAVTRTPAEALDAVRAAAGLDVAVELTGKLSSRMAKALGLRADEVRSI